MIFNLQASGRDARRNLLAGPSLAALALAALWPAAVLAQEPAPAPTSPPAAAKPAPDKAATDKAAADKAAALSGVTVQAAPQAAVRTSIDRRSYSVSTDLKGSNGSIADALRNIPGAEVDLNGNLTLRGGAVQIMVDGQPSQIFSGPQAAQVLQTTPADRIDRVEVINNPSAAF